MSPIRLLAVFLVATLTACAATGPRFAEVEAGFPSLGEDQSRIFFYRENSAFGAALTPDVLLDGQRVGELKPGSFFFVDREAGTHTASASTEATSQLELTTRAGETKYVSLAFTIGVFAGHPKLTQRRAADATAALAELAYIGAAPVATSSRSPGRQAPRSVPAASANTARAGTQAPVPARSQVFEYELRDRITGNSRSVVYRLERIEDGKLYFNQGSRVEQVGGAVVKLTAPIGGEFDLAMPPGGWIAAEPEAGASWNLAYQSGIPGSFVGLELEARTREKSRMRIKDSEFRVVRVEFTGFTQRGSGRHNNPPGRYKASAWYAPELGRVVRFEVVTRGGLGGPSFFIDEELRLVDIRQE